MQVSCAHVSIRKGGFFLYRSIQRITLLLLFLITVWLTLAYALPLTLPFLLGGALALAAEPMVQFLCARCRLPRPAAAGLGVTAAFCFLALVLLLVCALILRELGILAGYLPDLTDTAQSSMSTLSRWLLGLIARLPTGIRDILSQNVTEFFSGSSAMLNQALSYVLNLAGGILKNVPDSAFILGTGIISSYMISAKLPKIRVWCENRLSRFRARPMAETLRRLKTAFFGWLRAQLKLSGITWIILTLGLLLLRIPYAVLWSSLIAMLDAFPVLGTGTVLLPWSLICFTTEALPRGIGLLSLYVVITLSRSILEPRLVGRQLGLDPLATLAAVYAGYRLWGLGGMILAPILAVAAVQLLAAKDQGQ